MVFFTSSPTLPLHTLCKTEERNHQLSQMASLTLLLALPLCFVGLALCRLGQGVQGCCRWLRDTHGAGHVSRAHRDAGRTWARSPGPALALHRGPGGREPLLGCRGWDTRKSSRPHLLSSLAQQEQISLSGRGSTWATETKVPKRLADLELPHAASLGGKPGIWTRAGSARLHPRTGGREKGTRSTSSALHRETLAKYFPGLRFHVNNRSVSRSRSR